MSRTRVGAGLLAGCLFAAGAAQGQTPATETILKYRPKQEGVLYSVPSPQEAAACKVEAVKGNGKGAGWMLRDAQGRPMRRFYDSNYDGRARTGIDIYSYFHEGIETYRETLVNTREEPDQVQYRWMNAGGLRWGVDFNKDGKIDAWKAISPEELSQEVVRALVARDAARFQALLISEAEIKTLQLPADHAQRLRTQRANAETKFQAAVAKLTNLGSKTQWLHVELGVPQCLVADGRPDVVKYANGTVLCETGGKNDWVQTGEIIQVGPNTWRLTDAPTPGHEGGAGTGPAVADAPELQKLLKDLGEIDGEWAKKQTTPPAPADIVKYNIDRTNLIEKIIAVVKQEDRDQWIRQAADCLSAAAQSAGAKDPAPYQRLTSLLAQLEKALPAGHPLIAYVTFREMQADYGIKIADPTVKEPGKIQQEWLERLARFVKAHPSADDTAEALLSLGWGSELLGKEIEAKNWYGLLARDFGTTTQGAKAKGALRRLDAEGKPFELTGPTLAGASYDVASARGKVVIVYYWASWNDQSASDFDKLKQLIEKHGKDLELVTVNVDNSGDDASAYVKRTSAPGTHLHLAGGLESKLATDYGVMIPPNVFLVDREGKVANRTVQVVGLAEEVKRLLK